MDLVEYSRQPVMRQAGLKRHLNELIGRALAHVAESDRLALDTGDGAALCFFGDPEDALFAATNLRQAVQADPGPGAQVRIGINLGPIARVLVAQAAKDASDTVALADRLALHIDDPAKRAAFLRALDDL